MECTGLGKAELQRNIHHAAVGVAQVGDGHIAAQLILDRLVRLSFLVESAPQGGRGRVQLARQHFKIRQLLWQRLTQASADFGGQAVGVFVLHQDVLGNHAQELLHAFLILYDRLIQILRVECDRRIRLTEGQIHAVHDPVLCALRRLRYANSARRIGRRRPTSQHASA
jgi:hypothetical protein